MDRSLVNDELTLFSYEILGLVGRGGAGAHDLLRMAQRGRILVWAGESQYYVEPKRREARYVEAVGKPARRGSAPISRLTDRGSPRSATTRTPVPVHAGQERPALRAPARDLVGEEVREARSRSRRRRRVRSDDEAEHEPRSPHPSTSSPSPQPDARTASAQHDGEP